MTLEEPRQGYFLGKLVRKAKRAVKKVVKSPLGKAALLAGLANLWIRWWIFMGGKGNLQIKVLVVLEILIFGPQTGKFVLMVYLRHFIRDKGGSFNLGRAAFQV